MIMEEMTIEIAKEILNSGKLNDFIGRAESGEVDFKKQGYNLSSVKGKFELSKDISAFANSEGGIIILGVETKTSEQSKLDIVRRLSPIRIDDFDNSQYMQIIES
jgi:predicted HTH transcriptional regulator